MDSVGYSDLVKQLFEVVEVNLGGIPLVVAGETLRLVNPGLQPEQAFEIASDCDTRGVENLSESDFAEALKIILQNTDPDDASRAVKDVVLRLRVGVRRRFLMYEAPPNSLPPHIAEHSKAQAMFRELFDTISNGKDEISREQLRLFAKTALFDSPAEGALIVKSALGHPVTDRISFPEFVTIVQQATHTRHLSDMLVLMQNRNRQVEADQSPIRGFGSETPYRGLTASIAPSPSVIGGASGSAPGYRTPVPLQRANAASASPVPGSSASALRNLSREVESVKQQEYMAQRRFQDLVGVPTSIVLPQVPALPKEVKAVSTQLEDNYERELSKLRLENEQLRRDLLKLELEMTSKRSGSSPAQLMQMSESSDTEALKDRVRLLEKELRLARAHLTTARETGSLLAALQAGANPHAAVREYFPDESLLCSKHQYLRETSALLDDGKSPVAVILGQYDLVVVGYQSLYRDLRKKYEQVRSKRFDAAKAAASIVPASPTPSHRRSPSARRHPSPKMATASPVKWSDLDREPTEEMRNTGMLADPLLTLEQRNFLREKLAAQMRRSARNYRPPSQRALTPHREATVMTSLDAMQRLQQISEKAHRERRLE
jgi:hypothetical protein